MVVRKKKTFPCASGSGRLGPDDGIICSRKASLECQSRKKHNKLCLPNDIFRAISLRLSRSSPQAAAQLHHIVYRVPCIRTSVCYRRLQEAILEK